MGKLLILAWIAGAAGRLPDAATGSEAEERAGRIARAAGGRTVCNAGVSQASFQQPRRVAATRSRQQGSAQRRLRARRDVANQRHGGNRQPVIRLEGSSAGSPQVSG